MEGDDLPDFWCTVAEGAWVFLFAHPATQTLRYPLAYGQPGGDGQVHRRIAVNAGGARHRIELAFGAHQSLLLEVTGAGVTRIPTWQIVHRDV